MAKEKKPNPFAKGDKKEKTCPHCKKPMSKCKCKEYKK